MTQSSRILSDLKAGARITPLDALRCYGCMRLGARVWDLRQAGHHILSERITDPETGKVFARYRMGERVNEGAGA